jgi:hypothetical protein
MSVPEDRFRKVLVAKYSPQNGCYVVDGEQLTVVPRRNVPLKEGVSHYFVSIRDSSKKSKYGWVKETAEFTVSEFANHSSERQSLSSEELEHVLTMLRAIDQLPPDAPVAATYFCRGVDQKKMVFAVHKVVFYRG